MIFNVCLLGFLADQQTPMIWRGPMVTSAIKTFTQKVNWNNLDLVFLSLIVIY